MPRVIHFEIQAEDPGRAIAFYTAVFDWTFQKWEGPMPYWLIVTGAEGTPGINGGLLPRHGGRPLEMASVNAYVCTVDVPNLDEYLVRSIAAGGPTVVPKMPIPGIGWLAYCKDPEGNIFGMMQSDKSAA